MRIAHPQADELDAQRMAGAWYIIESNLAFWETRLCACVVYEPMPDESSSSAPPPSVVRMKDYTEYRTGTLEKQSGVEHLIGIDTQNPTNPTCWRWKSSFLLGMLTSDWQMVKHDPDYTWAITIFSSTTFTKAGLDIYSRDPVMSPEKLAEIKAVIEADPFLKARAVGMFKTIQDPRGRNRQ